MYNLTDEDVKNVKFINKQLNTNYRTIPYNLDLGQDLLELLKITTAEYLDILNYKINISNMEESFDCTLENYKTSLWVKQAKYNTTGNNAVDNIIRYLSLLSNNLYDYKEEIKADCKELWEKFLFDESNYYNRADLIKDINYYDNETIRIALNKTLNDYSIFYTGSSENAIKEFTNKLIEYLKD